MSDALAAGSAPRPQFPIIGSHYMLAMSSAIPLFISFRRLCLQNTLSVSQTGLISSLARELGSFIDGE